TWTGPCGGSLTDPQCSFNLEGDTTVTASFIPQWHLTVSVETPYGGAGSVHTIDDPTTGNRIPGIDCSGSGPDCEELFRDQTLVHLKAEPAPGSIFYAWGGACLGVTTDVCSLEMASDIEAVAAFRPLLTLTITPQTFGWNGSGQVLAYDETGQNVILECLSISPSCSVSYPYGLTAKVEAVPDLSSLFSGWAGACSGTGRTCWVTMEVNESVEATFKLIYTLTLTKAGTGRGTVTSNDPGLKINCGRGCLSDQGTYGEGEAVLLTAAPDSSSIFSGWSENCAVSGQNGEVCTVTMSGAETTIAVTSEFNRARLAPGNQVRGAKRRASAPPK
ncbi:MAG: hypothetical protein HYY13_04630, partial [Nitrospirae bacterium]|nr:hypothetical protein [Nitrospirota bacterium]